MRAIAVAIIISATLVRVSLDANVRKSQIADMTTETKITLFLQFTAFYFFLALGL